MFTKLFGKLFNSSNRFVFQNFESGPEYDEQMPSTPEEAVSPELEAQMAEVEDLASDESEFGPLSYHERLDLRRELGLVETEVESVGSDVDIDEMEFTEALNFAGETTDPQVLDDISSSNNSLIRRRVIENPNTSFHTLNRMAVTAFDSIVRDSINDVVAERVEDAREAASTSDDVSMLAWLSNHPDESVRTAVAQNPNTNSPIFRNLLNNAQSDTERSIIETAMQEQGET